MASSRIKTVRVRVKLRQEKRWRRSASKHDKTLSEWMRDACDAQEARDHLDQEELAL